MAKRKRSWKQKNPPGLVTILGVVFQAGRFFISLFKFLEDLG